MPLRDTSTLPEFEETFGLGVTGHRPNELEASDLPLLHDHVREVLQVVKRIIGAPEQNVHSVSNSVSVVPRIISPLAEGADRIVAEEGLATGYSLYCPLPFHPHEYEKDFCDEASKRTFRYLLSKASLVRVLTDRVAPNQRNSAYIKSGQEVLRCSDVLIAIWDGNPKRGEGGTAEIVNGALVAGIPVVWVHATADHDICLLPSPEQQRLALPHEIFVALNRTFPEYNGPVLFPA